MSLTTTNIPDLKLLSRGKVREIYDLDENSILIVTTDRISAFDVIMDEPITGKGTVLNQISLFWMKRFESIVPNHIIESDFSKYPAILQTYKEQLEGRSVIAKKAKPLPVECIVRGYVVGSGWKDYKKTGAICGHVLPKGLLEAAKLEKPIFTPSTKAELGAHDENITIEQAQKLLGKDIADRVERITLAIYSQARDYAAERGIIIADTKLEFGMVGDELILIDEVLSPDSSRFWPMNTYEAGKSPESFDKQYLRDWLETQPWNKEAPAPKLPKTVIDTTSIKYKEVYQILTSK